MRVVIAEDSVLLREGLAKLLEDEGFEVVGRAGDADDLLLKVRAYSPDVAIVDVRMPPTHTDEGARAAATIREQHPEVGVLLLSQVVEATFALRLFTESPAGFGYLLKDRVARRGRLPRRPQARRARRHGDRSRRSSRSCSAARAPDDPLADADRARARACSS